MNFGELVEIVADEPLFKTGLLLAGEVDAANVHRQLSRWTSSGRRWQLRRGLYALAPPWRKHRSHPFLVANRLAPGSYVSGLSALAFVRAIPEHVAEVTSCTGGRPRTYHTPLGRFSFRCLKAGLRFAIGGLTWALVNRLSWRRRRRRCSTWCICIRAPTMRATWPNCASISMFCAWTFSKRWPEPAQRRSCFGLPGAFGTLPARSRSTRHCEGLPQTTGAGA